MKMKEKVKAFYEKHEDKIKVGAGVLAIGAAGYCLGVSKYAGKSFVTNDGINLVLKEADKRFDIKNIYTGEHMTGLTPSELGKLGEKIMLSGGENDMKFTHFIAIGDGK